MEIISQSRILLLFLERQSWFKLVLEIRYNCVYYVAVCKQVLLSFCYVVVGNFEHRKPLQFYLLSVCLSQLPYFEANFIFTLRFSATASTDRKYRRKWFGNHFNSILACYSWWLHKVDKLVFPAWSSLHFLSTTTSSPADKISGRFWRWIKNRRRQIR